MKKTIIIIALLTLSCIAASYAKRPNPKKFEFEIGGGYPFYGAKNSAKKFSGDFVFYLEGRFNLKKLPIDIGAQISLSTFHRKDHKLYPSHDLTKATLVPFADYYFRRGKKVNPYVGFGVGTSYLLGGGISGVFDNEGYEFKFAAIPRIGIRFFNRFTVSTNYEIVNSKYSHWDFRIGYYF